MKVIWTDRARRHAEEIRAHVATESPLDADRLLERIFHRADQIEAFPYSGRIVPERKSPAVREVFEPPYRIIYRIQKSAIQILAVIHGARRLR